MAAAARVHLVEKGKDPRRYAMVGFGGAGPAHAANVAELAGTATPATYAGILAELQAIADAMREVIERAD